MELYLLPMVVYLLPVVVHGVISSTLCIPQNRHVILDLKSDS